MGDKQNLDPRDAFRQGQGSAKIKNLKDAFLRAALVSAALFVALFSPVEWYWKIAIFAVTMFVIGLIVQGFAMRRERRQSGP
jgi:hypothetical protein